MPFCSFSEGAAMFDVTPIENMFLLEYLPTAPDGFLRVYLHARMLCLHPELGQEIGDVARALNMDEDAVLNAFQYWEQQGLVEKLSDRPASYAIRPLRGDAAVRAEADRDYYKYREYNSSLQDMFGAAELLEPRHYKIANDWLNVLGFTQDAALRLLEHEMRLPGGRKPTAVFRRADKRAVEWAERGIRTLEQVEQAIAYDDRVYAMAHAAMGQLGINRKPTPSELDCVRRWIDEWKLTEADVIAACAQTTKSRAPSIGYLDAILRARADGGADAHFANIKAVLKELGAANAVPTPDQTKKYVALLEQGFEPEAILLAAVQCARKRKNSFEELEWMIGKWGEAGVRTREQAEKYVSDMQQATREVRSLLEAAGLSRRPNMDDLERYEHWKREYSPKLMRCAAECARGTRMPVKYMEKLLSEWKKEGIETPEAARARHGATAAAPGAGAPPQRNYQQHSYTEADFGEDFYYDPAKDYGEEGGK